MSSASSSSANSFAWALPTLDQINYDKTWDKPVESASRPSNSFLLFRQWHADRARSLGEGSSPLAVGAIWAQQPQIVKAHWAELARQVKRKHLERYPGYVYKPKSGKTKEERKENSRPYPSQTSGPSKTQHKSIKRHNSSSILGIGGENRDYEGTSNGIEDAHHLQRVSNCPLAPSSLLEDRQNANQYQYPTAPAHGYGTSICDSEPRHEHHPSTSAAHIHLHDSVYQVEANSESQVPQLSPTESFPPLPAVTSGDVAEDLDAGLESSHSRPSGVAGNLILPMSVPEDSNIGNFQLTRTYQKLELGSSDERDSSQDEVTWDEWINFDA